MILDDDSAPWRFHIHDRDSKFCGPFDELRAEGLRIIRTPYRAPRASVLCAVRAARAVLKSFAPTVVVSKGSDVCISSWWRLGLPARISLVLHESDTVPGSEHLFTQRFSAVTCVGLWRPCLNSPQVVLTGNPTRPKLSGGTAPEPVPPRNFPTNPLIDHGKFSRSAEY